ncbi:MAG TPA: hypothetical protein VFY81_07995 [Gammaproteobacteria bacterium]|nr:hypothetical protein [Gammaproteobacteria bacterium]
MSGDSSRRSSERYTGKRTLSAIKNYLSEVRARKTPARAEVFSYEDGVGGVGIDIETGERHAW